MVEVESASAPPSKPRSLLCGGGDGIPVQQSRRPPLRLTTEYDSDSAVFFHKISCKFLDSLAKLKLSFQNDNKGQVSEPQLAFTSRYLSVLYDLEGRNALVNASVDCAPGLRLRASQNVKEQQGEVTMVADLAPAYKLELTSAVPSVGLPKATLNFPLGEVSLEEREEEEEDDTRRLLSLNGILKGQLFNGICNAQYQDENLNLRYSYKDDQMTFIPSISLPSNAVSFAFKRRLGPSDKLREYFGDKELGIILDGAITDSCLNKQELDKKNYFYNFDTNYWSAVYKHTIGKDYKVKAGYDSEVRLGWASLWVGDESGNAKTAPMKTKAQFMLQVPQDDIGSSSLMFRVKKRWDI